MKLPELTPVSDQALAAISMRHGLRCDRVQRLPSTGIIHAIYALDDDHILRVPRKHSEYTAQTLREAAAIPAAVAAGVRTPAIVAFDNTRDILPVPYLIVERVCGVNLESLAVEASSVPIAWRELGRDLALLHVGSRPPDLPGPCLAMPDEGVDPRILLDRRVKEGWLSPVEAKWLRRWFNRLAPLVRHPVPQRFIHADVQMTNIMVDAESHAYAALIDWGCAHVADPSFGFLDVPLRAVPFLLAGYRMVAPLDDDETGEARILWQRLQVLLSRLPYGKAPVRSWGEQPITWLVDLLRFFLNPPDERWRALAPDLN